ncbi:MlaD family protein [Nocardia sp. NBC_00511]|uniref:MlaD family protein n=1 Tax=Nocardia sp. NBC_00511 TaxID=2903591 RepID=UPI0030E35B0D
MSVDVLTRQLGAGLKSGADVRLDGVKVGAVADIAPITGGRQRITLRLDSSQLFGLTDALGIDFAPGNLFGISEIELQPGGGGAALHDGTVVDLSDEKSSRTRDATLSTVLASVGTLTGDVLTPQLATVLSQLSGDIKGFVPLLQSIVVTIRAMADTQNLPASFLLGQLGQTLSGLPATVDGGLRLLYYPYTNQYMASDANRARFDATIAAIRNGLVPAVDSVLATGEKYYAGLTGPLAPLLGAIAASVGTPQRSGQELSQLLDRLGKSFRDTPDGPVLDIAVELRGVPGLAVPLLAGLPVPATVGGR